MQTFVWSVIVYDANEHAIDHFLFNTVEQVMESINITYSRCETKPIIASTNHGVIATHEGNTVIIGKRMLVYDAPSHL